MQACSRAADRPRYKYATNARRGLQVRLWTLIHNNFKTCILHADCRRLRTRVSMRQKYWRGGLIIENRSLQFYDRRLSKIFQFCINLVFSSLHSSLCSSVHRFVTAFSLHHSLKYAVVTPALKKSTLDPSDANNYRPISNLTFISKLLERIVLIAKSAERLPPAIQLFAEVAVTL